MEGRNYRDVKTFENDNEVLARRLGKLRGEEFNNKKNIERALVHFGEYRKSHKLLSTWLVNAEKETTKLHFQKNIPLREAEMVAERVWVSYST